MKKVICLYRVSTVGQVDHDDIPMQRLACREYAATHPDWEIIEEISEKGVSGYKVSTNARDAIVEIKRRAAQHEFDVLLVFIRSDFDQLLLDVKKDSPSNAKRAAMFTKDTMKNMSAKLKKGGNRFTLGEVSPETLVNSILGQLDMTDAPESVKPEMNRVVARLREDLMDYFNILKAAKEQIG